jgi:hypothetical protein
LDSGTGSFSAVPASVLSALKVCASASPLPWAMSKPSV